MVYKAAEPSRKLVRMRPRITSVPVVFRTFLAILAIAGLSLLVGSYGLAKLFFPAIASHAAERELLFGCAAVGIVSLSFLIGLRLAHAPVPVRPPLT